MTVQSCGFMSQRYIIVTLTKNQDMTVELGQCPGECESNHRVRTPLITQIRCIDRHLVRDGFFGFLNESALVGFLEGCRSLGGEHSAVWLSASPSC